jgi:hypothetical protein
MAFNKNLPVLGAKRQGDYFYFAERTETGWVWRADGLLTSASGYGWGYRVGLKYLRVSPFYSTDDGLTWHMTPAYYPSWPQRWACDSPYADKGKIITLEGVWNGFKGRYDYYIMLWDYKSPHYNPKKRVLCPEEISANGIGYYEIAQDGIIHVLVKTDPGTYTTYRYWGTRDFGKTWTTSTEILTLPHSGGAQEARLHGAGDNIVIAYEGPLEVSTYPAGTYLYGVYDPGNTWWCYVELYYCPSTIYCYVSRDKGVTWQLRATPFDTYGSAFGPPFIFRYTILNGPYAGMRVNWDYVPPAGHPRAMAVGSINGSFYVLVQKYEILKTVKGGPYVNPVPGYGDPPSGPEYVLRLMCCVSEGWSGNLNLVDTVDLSAGAVSNMQMRTGADKSSCYGVAIRGGFHEVFANGELHLAPLGGPPSFGGLPYNSYNMNYPVIIKEPAGYSFWW